MEAVILPIEKKPVIRAYLHYAFPHSVMLTQKYSYEWIINHYIQMVYDPVSSCPYDYHEFLYECWPCLKVNRLDRRLVEELTDVTGFLIRNLQAGVYTVAWTDSYEIPDSAFYQQEHQTHGVLLFGYEPPGQSDAPEDGTYHALVYTPDQQFRETRVPCQILLHSFDSEQFTYLQTLRPDPAVSVDYDFLSIRRKLTAYLQSENIDFDDIKFHRRQEIASYGVTACRQLVPYLQSRREPMDLRWPYVFYEHTRAMAARIKAVVSREEIVGYPYDWSELDRLTRDAKHVLDFCIKYNATRNRALLERSCVLIGEILEREAAFLQPLVQWEPQGPPRYGLRPQDYPDW